MLNQNFVYLAILIDAIGTYSYFIDTVKGRIRPNKVSFALWSLAPLIAFFAEMNQGVGIQSLMTLSVGFFPFIIFLGSFVNKKAYWEIKKFDVFCGVISLVGLFLWYITQVGNWAIFFSILADGFAYIPTFRKAYQFPETESAWPWLAYALTGLVTIATINDFNFANLGYPAYIFLSNLLVYLVVQFQLGKRKLFVIID